MESQTTTNGIAFGGHHVVFLQRMDASSKKLQSTRYHEQRWKRTGVCVRSTFFSSLHFSCSLQERDLR